MELEKDYLEDFPALVSSSTATGSVSGGRCDGNGGPISKAENEGKDLNHRSWRDFFPSPRPISQQPNLKFTAPSMVKGRKMVSATTTDFGDGSKCCEKMVVGFFAGKRGSFAAVKNATSKFWKLKGEVSIKLHGNVAFIFEFKNEDDRKIAIDAGSFYIGSNLFTIRPWSLLLEKTLTEIKSVPIWISIYGVPLHLWNSEGLGLIASFIGNPLFADDCTINRERFAFARVCVDIDVDCDFPQRIPLLVDGKLEFELPVEYQWRPPICTVCQVFGHSSKNCTVKRKHIWAPKKGNLQDKAQEIIQATEREEVHSVRGSSVVDFGDDRLSVGSAEQHKEAPADKNHLRICKGSLEAEDGGSNRIEGRVEAEDVTAVVSAGSFDILTVGDMEGEKIEVIKNHLISSSSVRISSDKGLISADREKDNKTLSDPLVSLGSSKEEEGISTKTAAEGGKEKGFDGSESLGSSTEFLDSSSSRIEPAVGVQFLSSKEGGGGSTGSSPAGGGNLALQIEQGVIVVNNTGQQPLVEKQEGRTEVKERKKVRFAEDSEKSGQALERWIYYNSEETTVSIVSKKGNAPLNWNVLDTKAKATTAVTELEKTGVNRGCSDRVLGDNGSDRNVCMEQEDSREVKEGDWIRVKGRNKTSPKKTPKDNLLEQKQERELRRLRPFIPGNIEEGSGSRLRSHLK